MYVYRYKHERTAEQILCITIKQVKMIFIIWNQYVRTCLQTVSKWNGVFSIIYGGIQRFKTFGKLYIPKIIILSMSNAHGYIPAGNIISKTLIRTVWHTWQNLFIVILLQYKYECSVCKYEKRMVELEICVKMHT